MREWEGRRVYELSWLYSNTWEWCTKHATVLCTWVGECWTGKVKDEEWEGGIYMSCPGSMITLSKTYFSFSIPLVLWWIVLNRWGDGFGGRGKGDIKGEGVEVSARVFQLYSRASVLYSKGGKCWTGEKKDLEGEGRRWRVKGGRERGVVNMSGPSSIIML